MSTPLNADWRRIFDHVNFAHKLHAPHAPAALRRAAQGYAEDSWQAAALGGAAQASTLLAQPALWLGHGAVLGARAAGLATGPAMMGIAAYPMARLAFGTGLEPKGVSQPPSFQAQLASSGIFGLPERGLRSAAHSPLLAQAPKCRAALLGTAVGLCALIQVPRLCLGLVGFAAALGGAALGLLAYALGRAVAALKQMPEQARRLIAYLQTQKAQLETMVSTAAVLCTRAQDFALAANQSYQRAAQPLAALRAWARQAPETWAPLGRAAPDRPASAASPAASDGPHNGHLSWLEAGVQASVHSAQMGAHYLRQSAEVVVETAAGAQRAAGYAAAFGAQLQTSPQLTEGYTALCQLVSSLPFGTLASMI